LVNAGAAAASGLQNYQVTWISNNAFWMSLIYWITLGTRSLNLLCALWDMHVLRQRQLSADQALKHPGYAVPVWLLTAFFVDMIIAGIVLELLHDRILQDWRLVIVNFAYTLLFAVYDRYLVASAYQKSYQQNILAETNTTNLLINQPNRYIIVTKMKLCGFDQAWRLSFRSIYRYTSIVHLVHSIDNHLVKQSGYV